MLAAQLYVIVFWALFSVQITHLLYFCSSALAAYSWILASRLLVGFYVFCYVCTYPFPSQCQCFLFCFWCLSIALASGLWCSSICLLLHIHLEPAFCAAAVLWLTACWLSCLSYVFCARFSVQVNFCFSAHAYLLFTFVLAITDILVCFQVSCGFKFILFPVCWPSFTLTFLCL